MKDLLEQWSQRPKRTTSAEPLRAHEDRIINEVRILEALEAAGCVQIPNESRDVAFMIDDRYRRLDELRSSVS